MRSTPTVEGHRSRLRERFEKSGFQGFSEHEIIEVLLTLCIPRTDVKQPAKDLLRKFGSIRGVLDAPASELRTIKGIGNIAPIALRIIRETADLYLRERAQKGILLDNSDKLEHFWLSRLGGIKNEVFEVAYLDSYFRLMNDGIERLEEGIIDQTVVYPRKVISAALKRDAAAIILAHNHPAGAAKPSQADLDITNVLLKAAVSLNLQIIDHLIIAGKEIFSFRRNGLIGV